jgi:hypothetical protein
VLAQLLLAAAPLLLRHTLPLARLSPSHLLRLLVLVSLPELLALVLPLPQMLNQLLSAQLFLLLPLPHQALVTTSSSALFW